MSEALRSLLERAGLPDCYQRFLDEDIDAALARTLTDEDLRELGLTMGQRKRFRTALSEPKPEAAPLAERRHLTVVFCDLVGSTQLATRLDPEDMRDVISAYLDTGIATMQAHGGHLAYTQGDGIMVYFGFPVAQEDDAQRAVRAALATVEAIKKLQTRLPDGLQVRLGVATGNVVIGDLMGSGDAPQDFVVGETPNLAARLQGLAAPGEIVIAAETYALTSGFFTFEARGNASLKGFADSVPVYAVLAERAAGSRFDARMREGLQTLVGREAELERLLGLWSAALAGQGRLGLLEGPPGIGKSRILRELQAKTGTNLLEWQCAPHLANRALHPMIHEIERAAGIERAMPDDVQQARLQALIDATPQLVDADLPILADLLGIDGAEMPQLDALAKSRRTIDVLTRRIKGLIETGGPLLLVLEDTHWADPATHDYLLQLVAALDELPVLLILSHRPEYTTPAAFKIRGELIALQPLSDDAVLTLVSAVDGAQSLPHSLMRQIMEKTDGVPLFVEELTKTVLNTRPDLVQGDAAAARDGFSIPSTLQDSLMSRLDQMQGAKEIAQLASVIGRAFTAAMVGAIAPQGRDVEAALQQLVTAEILHNNGLDGPETYVFNHALIQDTAYESILKSRRREVHLTLAKAILASHPAFGGQEPEIIARHCDIGGLAQEAVTHWLRAGQEALGRAANLAAVRHLNAALRVLATLPEDQSRHGTELGIQMSLMPAAMSIFGWGAEEVETAAFRARDLAGMLGDGQALYGATWGVWTMHFLRGEMDECLAAARQADQMAQAVGTPLLLTTADHAVGYSHLWRGELQDAMQRFEAGHARHDPAIETEIIANFQFSSSLAIRIIGTSALWLTGQQERAATVFNAALTLAEELGHAPSMAYGLGGLGQALTMQQDWARIDVLAHRCREISVEEGFILWQFVAEMQAAIARGHHRDDPEGGVEAFMTARERFLSTGAALTDILYYPALGDLLHRLGRSEEVLGWAQSGIEQAEARQEKLYLSELYRMRGEAQRRMGASVQARTDFETALNTARQQGAASLVQRAEAALEDLMV